MAARETSISQESCAVLSLSHSPTPTFFAQVRVDDDLGTVVWPDGADLDPLVLHGDFEPAARIVHR
jgi:Protein of unknown function (DUF2442)